MCAPSGIGSASSDIDTTAEQVSVSASETASISAAAVNVDIPPLYMEQLPITAIADNTARAFLNNINNPPIIYKNHMSLCVYYISQKQVCQSFIKHDYIYPFILLQQCHVFVFCLYRHSSRLNENDFHVQSTLAIIIYNAMHYWKIQSDRGAILLPIDFFLLPCYNFVLEKRKLLIAQGGTTI